MAAKTTYAPPVAGEPTTYEGWLEYYRKKNQGDKYQTPEQREESAQKQAKAKSGGGSSVGPLVAGVGGSAALAYGRAKLAEYLKTKAAEEASKEGAKQVGNVIARNGAPVAAQTAGPTFGDSTSSLNTGTLGSPTAEFTLNPNGSAVSTGGAVNPNGTITTADGVTVNPNTQTAVDAKGNAVTGDYLGTALAAAGAVFSAYQAYQQYKQGDKVGAGLSAVSAGASGAAAAGSSTASAAAWPLALAMIAYNGQKNYEAAHKASGGGNFTSDEATSVYSPYRGTLDKWKNSAASHLGPLGQPLKNYIGFYEKLADYGPVGLAAHQILGSTKPDSQIMRDRMRKNDVDAGLYNNQDYQLKFADGGTFDMGLDGGARLQNTDGTDRRYSDVDFSNKDAGSVVGSLAPLTALLTGGSEKLASDWTGQYTNAVMNGVSNPTDYSKRILELYQRRGVDQATATQGIADLVKNKRIDQERADAYNHALGTVFAGQPAQAPAVAPIAPGQTPANYAQSAVGKYAAPALPPRSNTRSPGLDLKGNRISYGR